MTRLPDYEERKSKQKEEARSAWAEYRQQQLDTRERTARLRALRLKRQRPNRKSDKQHGARMP